MVNGVSRKKKCFQFFFKSFTLDKCAGACANFGKTHTQKRTRACAIGILAKRTRVCDVRAAENRVCECAWQKIVTTHRLKNINGNTNKFRSTAKDTLSKWSSLNLYTVKNFVMADLVIEQKTEFDTPINAEIKWRFP